MNRKILLVGQAPSRSAGKERAFDGPSGRRLAKLAGIAFEELFERFDTVNLLARWPGKHGGRYQYREKGDRFPIARAKRAAKKIKSGWWTYSTVILCGSRVAKAFGIDGPAMSWHDAVKMVETKHEIMFHHVRVLLLPHPSGCNIFYNSALKRAMACIEIHRAMGVDIGDDRPVRRGTFAFPFEFKDVA